MLEYWHHNNTLHSKTLRCLSDFRLNILTSTAVKHTTDYTLTFKAFNALRSGTAEGDSFQLRPCRSLYLPEYGLTMVMGMNGCEAFSLTSCGLINALEQARTLTVSQSDSCTPPQRGRGGRVERLGM